jgi:DNA-binding CsgD family transcriptional regulator
MWVQPDSAFAVMMEFAGSEAADSLDVFEGHYCQVLIAELLFKNDYGQSNRKDLLKAVRYFDSIVGMDGYGTDTRGVSVQEREAFLAARAHYINGVGYYERDSLIDACEEYLNALRMMEEHFEEKVLVGHEARFMALTYNRLVELFSKQFMQEPAIYCGKQSLIYSRIAPTTPYAVSNVLYRIGKQYDKLKVADSAAYYYDRALEIMPDRNNLIYRDIISSRALFDYEWHHDTIRALDSLKRMATQAANETERLHRFPAIGNIYQDIGQYDSAKAYLMPVFESENEAIDKKLAARVLHIIAISEGDTLNASQYAQILVEDVTSTANKQLRNSQLNDLFQKYLQEKQETALALERLEARRRNLWIGGMVALLAIVGLAVAIVTRRSHRKRLAAQEAEAQRRLDEASQRLSEASQRHDAAERELQTKVEQATLHTKEVLQQRAMALYHGKEKDKLQRILAEFDGAYPKTYERMMAAYPDLSMQEYELCVLGYFDFRAKEIAQLMDLQEGTVYRYRSTIRKKTGADDLEALMGRFLD